MEQSAPTGYLLTRIAQAQTARFGRRIEILGIRPKHFGLLLAVEAASRSQAELAREQAIDPAALAILLDDLETRAAIVRVPDPAVHHRTVVELTNIGRVMLETAKRNADEVDTEIFSALDAEQRAVLDAGIRLVAESPSARNRVDPLD